MTQRNISLLLVVTVLMLAFAAFSFAQSGTDKVRLFQSYFLDTPIAKTNHVQPGLSYATTNINDYKFSTLALGANGGYAASEKLEILGGINYISISPEEGDGESGLSDLAVYARYKLSEKKETQFSVGGMLTLPIGSEDIGYGSLNFGGYTAIRHALKDGIVITGNIALLFEEYGDDRESSMELGAGVIYPMANKLNLVGELVIKSDKDFMMITGGVDKNMSGGRLRGAIGLGLDDGAPDFQIIAGYLKEL